MPCDDPTPQQIDETRQQRQRSHLAQRAGNRSEEHVLIVDRRGRHRPELDRRQRRSTRKGIGHGTGRLRERRHLGGIGDQQEDTPDQRGVERVLAQTAEGHLADGDGHESADHDDPPRNRRRKVEGQQHAGHHRREVSHSRSAAQHEPLDQILEHDAAHHRQRRNAQHAPTEEQRRDDQRGQQRDHHVAHDLRRGLRTVDMRRRRDKKIDLP